MKEKNQVFTLSELKAFKEKYLEEFKKSLDGELNIDKTCIDKLTEISREYPDKITVNGYIKGNINGFLLNKGQDYILASCTNDEKQEYLMFSSNPKFVENLIDVLIT